MKKRMVWLSLAASLLWLIGIPATLTSTPMFTECPAVGQDAGCQVLVTINAGGSLSFQVDPSQPSFDPSGDDTLVGVLNDSGVSQQSITLSGNGIFAFDDDGPCNGFVTYTPSPAGCSGPLVGFYAVTSYEGYDQNGNFDSFSPQPDNNSGMIIFINKLTPNDSAFFALQGTLSDINGISSSTVPEPASVFLIGTGLLALLLLTVWRPGRLIQGREERE